MSLLSIGTGVGLAGAQLATSPAGHGVPAVNWALLTPAILPALAALLILAVDALAPRLRALRYAHDVIALAALLAAAAGAGRQALEISQGNGSTALRTLCLAGSGTELPACGYVVSPLTLTAQVLVVLSALIALLLAVNGPGARDRASHHVLFLSAISGAMVLAGARDLATLIVALETVTVPAIALVALRRDAQGTRAALSLLFTAVASLGLLLLGAGLILLATGSVEFGAVATAVSDPSLARPARVVAVLGALFALGGVAFKLSLVPFHWWTPETYEGAPVPVAAFLALVSKAAGLIALVEIVALAVPGLTSITAPLLGVVAAITMTVGNLVALRQTHAVRLLAWSAVAQAGWILVPLAAAGAGTLESRPAALRAGVAASFGYLAMYLAASAAAFAVVVVLSRHHPDGEEHSLQAYRGLLGREPVAAGVLALALACLAGLPPGIAGLMAKVVVFSPLVNGGQWALAAVGAVNVVLAIVYYVRWAALMAAPAQGAVVTWRLRVAEGLALGAGAVATIGLSVAPQALAGLLSGPLQ